jgi:SAM-dependent methyltransferase
MTDHAEQSTGQSTGQGTGQGADAHRTQPASKLTELVQAQFGPVARAYVASSPHARGADLPRLVELAAPASSETMLDIATGGGHTALAFAPHVHAVLAIDLTHAMLEAAREHIGGLGWHNVGYCRGVAEALPVPTASCELVVCRVAAHHFANIRAFVREAARVLRPGGRLIVSDHIGIEDPDLDAFMDRFERWRDPGHVRAYSFAEWQDFCQQAALQIEHLEDFPWDPYEFGSWVERIRMPQEERDALEQWLLQAEPRYRERFEIVAQDGRIVSLRSTFGIIVARKPA